ncbi:MAG TPA: Stp1/IreP family PP2C-type Ser/Thr phosphatase [Rhodocyclaceae bacterium]|nr:Stp1/IreP family PP2C-type Ser/Thr phosphatase [Rhodocyclaceae bacterium]
MKLADALQVVIRSDPGVVRSHNEDSVFGSAEQGLVILADGMGGYNAGEVASGMAITLLSSNLLQTIPQIEPQAINPETGQRLAHHHLTEQVALTNTSIYQSAQSQPQYAGMGTTLVMAWFYDNVASVAHIGDSRLYRLRGEEFQQLTRDHSLLQEQIDSGMISAEEARFSQNKNLVTRALGVDPEVELEIHDYDVLPGDIFLLCSDGLNDMVEDEEIGTTVQMLQNNLELAGDQLIQMANDNGGRDNVSVILVKVRGDFAAPRRWWQKLLAWLK